MLHACFAPATDASLPHSLACLALCRCTLTCPCNAACLSEFSMGAEIRPMLSLEICGLSALIRANPSREKDISWVILCAPLRPGKNSFVWTRGAWCSCARADSLAKEHNWDQVHRVTHIVAQIQNKKKYIYTVIHTYIHALFQYYQHARSSMCSSA